MAAELLRRIDKDINVSDAAAKLIEMFGPAGKVSPAWLKRVWRAAGLNRGKGRASLTASLTRHRRAEYPIPTADRRQVNHAPVWYQVLRQLGRRPKGSCTSYAPVFAEALTETRQGGR